MWRNEGVVGMSAERRFYEGIVVLTPLSGTETCNMGAPERRKLNVGS